MASRWHSRAVIYGVLCLLFFSSEGIFSEHPAFGASRTRKTKPAVTRPVKPVKKSFKKSVINTPPNPQASLTQEQLAELDRLEARLVEARTEWYAKARDKAFLEQIVSEAQLTIDLNVAPSGSRLIFIEEYGTVLSDDALQALIEKDTEPPRTDMLKVATLKTGTYNQHQIIQIRDRGQELLSQYIQRQTVLKDEMQALLDEISATVSKAYRRRR